MRSDPLGRAIPIGCYVGVPVVLDVGTASASVKLKPNRHYRLWPNVDMFFQFGAPDVEATTKSHPIATKLDYLHYTDDTNTTLAAVVSHGTGALFISEIDTQGV